MANTDGEQPPRDETAQPDELAIDLLFRRIAERGRKKRNQQQAANEQVSDNNPTQDKRTMKEQGSEPNQHPDPIVEILRLAYRRGLALRKEQSKNETPLADNKVSQATSKLMESTRNKPEELQRIDRIITTLNHLEKAIARNDSRAMEIKLQTIRLALKDLRKLIKDAKKLHTSSGAENLLCDGTLHFPSKPLRMRWTIEP